MAFKKKNLIARQYYNTLRRWTKKTNKPITPLPASTKLELFLKKRLVCLPPLWRCLACISGCSLVLMSLPETTKRIREGESRRGGRPWTRSAGREFIRPTAPASPQQQIHYNNGPRSHQRANSGSGGAPRVDTKQSAHGRFSQCVKPGRRAARLTENRGELTKETSLPFAPASGGDSGPGSQR